MEIVLYSLIALIIGALVTILVSKFYYKKSKEKTSLRILLEYESEVFWDVDDDVKEDFQLEFQGKQVKELLEVNFIIFNNGNTPIINPIKPLALHFKHGYEIYDCKITKIKPELREVEVRVLQEDNRIEFDFEILNPADLFEVRAFIEPTHIIKENENVQYNSYEEISLLYDMEFFITAGNLEPELPIQKLDKEYESILRNTQFMDKATLVGSIILLLLFAALPIALSISTPDLSIFGKQFFFQLNFIKILIILHWFLVFFFSVFVISVITKPWLLQSRLAWV